jgi:hypothetical protein
MKWTIPAAACLLLAQQAAAQVPSDGNAPTITGPTTLRHMSAASGESRTFVVDVPAGSHQFKLVTEGGSGLLGVEVVSLGPGLPCQMEPSRDRGLVCAMGWQNPAPRSYSVTLVASPEEGYDDVTIRIAHGPRFARNGVTYSDVDNSVASGTGGGFKLHLEQPGPLSVSTWGGSGALWLQVVHHDGSFGGRVVCDLHPPGTWHTCNLPDADPGRYRIDLLGSFKDTNLRADWY